MKSPSGRLRTVVVLILLNLHPPVAIHAAELKAGVRGVATRAPGPVRVDGDLSEFRDAFCTPLEHFSFDEKTLRNRAAQFFYMWDNEAFYAGLRTQDEHPANFAPDDRLWEGDAVEWYFDARQNDEFRSQAWDKSPNCGAAHCYWTGLKGANVQARFCLRPGYLRVLPKIGVEVGSRRTASGMEVELKLPWANFPDFKPAANAVIALDAELCYSDGGPRVARAFVYGSPLSVQQPASLGMIQLVDRLEPEHWKPCGSVMFPVRCDTAWTQPTQPQITAVMAVPPRQAAEIGRILFRLTGLDGSTLGEFPGEIESVLGVEGFQRAVARWSNDLAAPGTFQLTGIVFDPSGRELTRVAPRMVSVGMTPGY